MANMKDNITRVGPIAEAIRNFRRGGSASSPVLGVSDVIVTQLNALRKMAACVNVDGVLILSTLPDDVRALAPYVPEGAFQLDIMASATDMYDRVMLSAAGALLLDLAEILLPDTL